MKSSIKLPRWAKIILLLGTLAVLLAFGWEIGKLAWIGAGRAKDKADAMVRPAVLERDYDAVVGANTEQALQIEEYLTGLRLGRERPLEDLGLDFSSVQNYRASQAKLRSLVASSLSYPPPAKLTVPEAPVLVQLAQDELATYYELRVHVLERVEARGIFMMPRVASGRVPLVIAAHGRGGQPARTKNGKLTIVGRSNRDLALGALQRGYAVWEPIFVFYAEGRPDDLRTRLEMRAREVGTSLPAIEIAKVLGGLDAILKTQPIDPDRVAMVGLSYGGFYTLYTTALDDRIRVAVVAAYFNDRENILDTTEPFGMPDWRFPNSLSIFQDHVLVALVCPRPLQIQVGDHDQLFPIAGARRALPLAKASYERLNLGQRFSFMEFVGRHEFNGEQAWAFIGRCFESETRPQKSSRREER